MNRFSAYSNPDHHLRPQWNKLMNHILAIEMLTVSFKDNPNDLAVILDKLEVIADQYVGYKKSLPHDYRRVPEWRSQS